ncbi:MAG: hypothetical protein CXZ00_13090 [Acidobacteria bacterium]|nr:MAG: hypothetical protein CXZ00_13090 [Acidobacteriota bacterium]
MSVPVLGKFSLLVDRIEKYNHLIMKMLLGCMLLFMSTGVFAQGCPVTFKEVRSRKFVDQTYNLQVKWMNTANKKIVGTSFKAIFINSVGDEYYFEGAYVSTTKLRRGESAENKWYDADELRLGGNGRAVVYPTQVQYEDGTTWENPGRECVSPLG